MTTFDSTFLRRRLPPELGVLSELALDLRWTWNHACDVLWRTIDEKAWSTTQNPLFILRSVSEKRLEELARDTTFRGELMRLLEERAVYFQSLAQTQLEGTVGYFGFEFGLGSAIPLYAGGLGILAGDFLKTASDLGLPVVGVGILYQEGYFRQSIDAAGRQHETYPYNDPSILPIEPAQTTDGAWARAFIELRGRRLWLRVWRVRVGRVELLLLDGNDPENTPADRGITTKLYGGDQETRLLQEMVLGIGGPRALEAVGVTLAVAHLNEGHSAFVALDRAREFAIRERCSFDEAWWAVRSANVFTTHSPAPEALDAFPEGLIAKHLAGSEYLETAGLSIDRLLALGRVDPADSKEPFSMVHLALRGCAHVNGVSRMHAEVSRRLFSKLYPRWPECEIPVSHVTNGVHAPSWDSAAADDLWTRLCEKSRWLRPIDRVGSAFQNATDEDLWSLRATERANLVQYTRQRLKAQFVRRGDEKAAEAGGSLDPNAFTLGFARRFVEYKRPNLLLENPERLVRILCDARRPAQLIIAGKAHPSDDAGKRMIAEWIAFFSRPDVRSRTAFIEDYDMAVAEELVSGVDVWLNTPRRPQEACGTSGMKVLVNGGLNISVLDGWWAEAWSPEVGWALGDDVPRTDEEAAEMLYDLLEQEVIPTFYDRDAAGVPRKWVSRVRASMSRLAPAYSSNRMASEYVRAAYQPALEAYRARAARGAALAKDLATWAARLIANWHHVHFGAVEVEKVADGLSFRTAVYLGDVDPDSIAVQLWADGAGAVDMVRDGPLSGAANGHVYTVVVPTQRPATDFTARVVPFHAAAGVPAELSLIAWQR